MVSSGGWNIKGVDCMARGWSRVATCACALLLVGSLSGCALTTPSRAEVQQQTVDPAVSAPAILKDGALTVAVDTSDAPQAMNGADGAPTGYYVDVARALAQRMGLKVSIVSASSAEKTLSNQKADLFIGASASDVKDDVTVSDSVGEDAAAIFAKVDGGQSAQSVTAESMAGAAVAVQDSSASQDALVRAGITATQKTYSNVNECFEALVNGEVQYVACDATAGAYLSRAYEGVSFAGIIGKVSSFCIAMADNSELTTAVTDAFGAMTQDGTLDALHGAWYGDLPLGLSDATLSGVTITSTSANDKDANEAPGDEAARTDTPITNDINSLNS